MSKPKTKRRNLVAEVMNTVCIYGGLLATRAEIQDDLEEVAKSHGRTFNWLFLDKLVFMNPEATPEQIEHLTKHGMTLKNLPAIEAKLEAQKKEQAS